jgi:hypothetical protein
MPKPPPTSGALVRQVEHCFRELVSDTVHPLAGQQQV